MDLSIFLAKVFAIYMIVTGVALVWRGKTFAAAFSEVAESPLVTLFSGIIALIIGALLVVSHNIWVMDWPVIITVFSWMSLAKGVMRLWFPHSFLTMTRYFANPKRLSYMGSFVLVMGLVLAYFGCSSF